MLLAGRAFRPPWRLDSASRSWPKQTFGHSFEHRWRRAMAACLARCPRRWEHTSAHRKWKRNFSAWLRLAVSRPSASSGRAVTRSVPNFLTQIQFFPKSCAKRAQVRWVSHIASIGSVGRAKSGGRPATVACTAGRQARRLLRAACTSHRTVLSFVLGSIRHPGTCHRIPGSPRAGRPVVRVLVQMRTFSHTLHV